MSTSQILHLVGLLGIAIPIGLAAWRAKKGPGIALFPVLIAVCAAIVWAAINDDRGTIWEIVSMDVAHRTSTYLMINYAVGVALLPRAIRDLYVGKGGDQSPDAMNGE